MRYSFGLTLLALTACSGGKSEDGDGDGYEAPLDCDDKNADVHPDAAETCDGVDNNCNGQIDELATAEMYPDDDGDGFGDGAAVEVCSGEPGYAREDGDCDDDDPDVNPDATELCDDLDRNCDGSPTNGATDFPTFYFDSDQDGFGVDDAVITTSCTRPAAYAEVGGDCDDGDDTINPDGTEVCNGADDDCNGIEDDNPSDAAMAWDDDDGDGYGDPATGAVQCAGAGIVTNGDDCDDTDRRVHPGVVDDCNGIDDDCDPATDEDVLFGDLWYVDGDGDGLGDDANTVMACTQPGNAVDVGGDCDDTQPLVRDGSPWYFDADLDGFGDDSTLVRACTQPPGLIAIGGDCNDRSNVSYPGAPEICDTLDNDCDLSADEGAIDATTFYTDVDGDLFGDPLSPVVACTQPIGTSASGTDCDDTSSDTFPGANELCDGGIDNDCDPLTNEALTAVNYRDADGDGYGVDSDTVFGCSPPPGYVQLNGDCDDTDPNVNPIATPDCTRLHCGTIALSETWAPPLKHRVTCDTTVQGAARPTLTIAAGTVVEFSANSVLKVGDTLDGGLQVDGDPLLPVTFTSTNLVKAPGQWDGIWIGARDIGSEIHSAIIEAAGSNAPTGSQPGGLVLTGADPFVEDLWARQNLGNGLVANAGAEPLIVRSSFTGNTGNGLYVAVGGGLSRLDESGTQGPSFQDNVLTGNGLRPITVPGSHADEIELSNTVSPNSTDEIELLSGILRFTGTWYDHGMPYVVAQSALIEVEDGPAAQLHVADDVQVFFNIGAELTVGVDAGGVLTTGANTVFTGTSTVIANSLNWKGVTFGTNDLGSVVADLEIAYGGANGKGNLYVNDSAPTISRVWSHDSDNAGIYVAGATAAPRIEDSDLTGNDTDGVFVEASSGVARDSLGPTFAGNVITGNGGAPVVFPPNFLGELDRYTSFFSGNAQRIGVHGGTVLDDAIWRKLDEDYQVRGDVLIGGPRDPVVEVEDLVTIWFDRDTSLRAGTVDDGILRVLGGPGPGEGVRFTSSDPAPGKGDWEGVMLGGATTGGLPDHLLANLTIEYAGGSDVARGGAIEFVARSGCTPSHVVDVQGVTVFETTKAAYYQHTNGTVRFDGFSTDASPDLAFHFDTLNPDCTSGYDIESQIDGSAKGLAIPTATPWGVWPAHELSDLLDPSHTPITSPTVSQTTMTRDSVFPDLGVPVVVTTNINIGGAAAPTATFQPGVVVEFDADAGLNCGTTAAGSIISHFATFTSAAASPAPGDWRGLGFNTACGVVIEDSMVEYAGGQGNGAIARLGSCCGQLVGQDAFTFGNYLLNVTVKDSSTCGMYEIDEVASIPYVAPLSTLPSYNATFLGSIGGLGNYCP